MSRSRILLAVAIMAVVAALVILVSATPVGAQFIINVSEVFATPIPLTGVEAVDMPAPAPAPRQIYIANDPLQSPLVTPMP